MSVTDTNAETSKAATIGGNGALVPVGNRLPGMPDLSWPYGVPARPEILTSKPNPATLLHALRRRWPLAIGLGVLTAVVVGCLVWYFVPVRYTAEVLLRVSSREREVIFDNSSGNQGGEEYANFKRTQKQLIRSSVVLTATLRKPEISRLSTIQKHKDDPVGWLADQLLVDYPGESEILQIALKGDNPVELAKIVNAVKDSYMNEVVYAERDERLKAREALQQATDKYREEILRKLESLNKMSKDTGGYDAQSKLRLALDDLERVIYKRDQVDAQIRDMELKVLVLKKRSEKDSKVKIPDYYVEQELAKFPEVQELKLELANAQKKLAATERVSQPTSRAVMGARRHLENVKDQLEEARTNLIPQIRQALEGVGLGAGADLPALEIQLEQLEKSADKLTKHLEEKYTVIEKMEEFNADRTVGKGELREMQEITSKMSNELRRWDVEMNTQPRIRELGNAVPPSGNDILRKYITTAFAACLGFSLLVFGVAYVEFQARRLNTKRDVNEGLGLRVLGDLPGFSGRLWRKVRGSQDPHAMLQALLAESIDGIRTSLIHNASGLAPKVVMVTSADAGEGKTTVATQLAGSLARSGRRTLLIDGDLRNPAIHRAFEMSQDPGLCDLLRGQAERQALVQPTPSPNLWLMPAGQCDLHSIQALASNTLSNLINALKPEFDFIIIDSGPVLSVADPLLIGQHIDVAIISVLRDVSKMGKVYEAVERLRSVGVTIFGTVVNGVSERPSRRYAEMLTVAQ